MNQMQPALDPQFMQILAQMFAGRVGMQPQGWDADSLQKPIANPAAQGNFWQGPLITQQPSQPQRSEAPQRQLMPSKPVKGYLSAVGNRIPIKRDRTGATADHLSVGQRQRYERIKGLYGMDRAVDAKDRMLNHNSRILSKKQNG